MGNIANVKCHLPSFRVDVVDKLVWEWIKTLLTKPGALEKGLAEYQESREQFCAPIRDRLIVLDDLWHDSKSQLDRVLDLYISGDIPRELLVDKKQRLESTLVALEKERDELNLDLETESITEKDIQQIREFAAQIAEGLEPGDETFDDRRRVIELLEVGASLTVEDGQKFIDVWCFLGRKKLSVGSPTYQNVEPSKGYPRCSVQIRHRQHHTYRRATWHSIRESLLSKLVRVVVNPSKRAVVRIQLSSVAEISAPHPSRHNPSHKNRAEISLPSPKTRA
jgi:hypothetical protein